LSFFFKPPAIQATENEMLSHMIKLN